MFGVLDVKDDVIFDETITKYQEHIVLPQTGTNYGNSAIISMEMGNQDIYTFPSKSYVYLEGTFKTVPVAGQQAGVPARSTISNNGFLQLFDTVTFHLNSVEIDRTRHLGVATSMKNYVSLCSADSQLAAIAGWNPLNLYDSCVDANGKFSVCIPLSMMLGFAEDHRKILVHARQRLTLHRTMGDADCYETTGNAEACKINLTHVSWRLPIVTPSDKHRLELLKLVEQNKRLTLHFRSWNVVEYPLLPQTTDHVWTIQSTTQLEKPRYVIVGFQTGRKNTAEKDASAFDHCSLQDIKVYIENECYPAENLNLNFGQQRYFILYRMFAMFRESFYGKESRPLLPPEKFKDLAPLAVIDCARQNDRIKQGAVNFRIEFKTTQNVPANSRAVALIIHDRLVDYNLLDNIVTVLVHTK